jgi:hypothetical protein
MLDRKWLRRFLAYVGAVMRHTTVLLLGLIGASILTVPSWVRPLLTPAYAATLDGWTVSLAQPTTYWLLAKCFLLGSIFVASFLAWNEEHEQVLKFTPRLEGEVEAITFPNLNTGLNENWPIEIYLHVAIKNLGAPTSIDKWRVSVCFPSERLTIDHSHLAMRRFSGQPNKEFKEPGDNWAADTTLLPQQSKRLGWLAIILKRWQAQILSKSAANDPVPSAYIDVELWDVANNHYVLPRWPKRERNGSNG